MEGREALYVNIHIKSEFVNIIMPINYMDILFLIESTLDGLSTVSD